jgi:site-specific DNA-adenine methylase
MKIKEQIAKECSLFEWHDSKPLKAPLSYQGGKQKLASKIVDVLRTKKYDAYVDVCCGSGAISVELINCGVLSENIYMFDGGPIGAFWQMVSEGTFDIVEFEKAIEKIPKDKNLIKKYLDSLSTITFDYVGEVIYEYLILQAGAFGGKQISDKDGKFTNTSFRNYWLPKSGTSRQSPVNPMMPMPETLLKNVREIVSQMDGVRATHTLVDNINLQFIADNHKSICIYIDPPYMGTTGYGLNVDLNKFIDNAKNFGDVYVSEYRPLSINHVILNKTNKGGISGNTDKQMVEYLNIFEKNG